MAFHIHQFEQLSADFDNFVDDAPAKDDLGLFVLRKEALDFGFDSFLSRMVCLVYSLRQILFRIS